MFRRTAVALVATAAVSLAACGLALFFAVAAAKAHPPSVPARIQVPAGNKPFLLAHAGGVQIYACATTADGPKWQLVAPRAKAKA